MTAPTRRSPLAHRKSVSSADKSCVQREIPFQGKLILRADPLTAADPVKNVLSLALPLEPNMANTNITTAIWWLGPDEWLIVTPPDTQRTVAQKLETALAALSHQLCDVSDYYTTIEISGSNARNLLARVTTLDLHERSFKAGHVAGSNFGKAAGWIALTTDEKDEGGPTFQLVVRWSMADYLWGLLAQAGRALGLAEQMPRAPIKGLRYKKV